MNRATTKSVPLTLDIRDRLKAIVEHELDGLPELARQPGRKNRLDVMLKLMPLVLPKAEAVHYDANEPSDWP
jgi:hypothetical protein